MSSARPHPLPHRVRRQASAPKRRRRAIVGREETLEAIRRWSEIYGEPPTLADWEPSRAVARGQAWRVERFEAGELPSVASVRHHFGSLNAAVREAGFEPRPRGRQKPRVHAPPAVVSDANASTIVLRVKALGEARRVSDRDALVSALRDLSSACLNWADRLAA